MQVPGFKQNMQRPERLSCLAQVRAYVAGEAAAGSLHGLAAALLAHLAERPMAPDAAAALLELEPYLRGAPRPCAACLKPCFQRARGSKRQLLCLWTKCALHAAFAQADTDSCSLAAAQSLAHL